MFSGRAPGSFPAGAESLLSKSLKNKESPDSSGFLQENTTLLLKDFLEIVQSQNTHDL
jgi:hypothetical protein